MVSPISYIGTVRISLHAVSVKYFVLPAHPISCWKTSIEVQRVTSVEVHSRKMHTGFIFATDTSARIGSLDCLCADKLSFCHLFHRFSVTMEPLYAFKASKHLPQNRSCRHQNANDRFGFKVVEVANWDNWQQAHKEEGNEKGRSPRTPPLKQEDFLYILYV